LEVSKLLVSNKINKSPANYEGEHLEHRNIIFINGNEYDFAGVKVLIDRPICIEEENEDNDENFYELAYLYIEFRV